MEKVINNPVPQNTMQPQASRPMVNKVKFSNKSGVLLGLGAVVVVLLGVFAGKMLSGVNIAGNTSGLPSSVAKNGAGNSNEAGTATAECKDEAEGTLEEGGKEGEGTHHLVRSADSTKDVYLGSTVLDLQSFVGKKVKVTGQTTASKKAGWLMDVCKIKVTE